MSTFVLVPGAWLGSWVWEPVARLLTEHGHQVHAVSLSGLAERADVPHDDVGLATHVSDVHDVLVANDLHDVVLVGHSYAGMVTGQVADRAPDRVSVAVYVDANLPHDGRAMTDTWSERGRQQVRDEVTGGEGRWPALELADLNGHGLTAEQADWLVERTTGHPGRTLFEPAVLATPLEASTGVYIACTKPTDALTPEAEALANRSGWTFVRLDTGHWPMVSAPDELASVLHGLTIAPSSLVEDALHMGSR